MEAGTRIHLCGPLRIHLAGQPREGLLHGRQGRLLFAFLVFRRHRPVTRDALVQALWGEEGMPPSEGALAPVLSRLRRAVAPATVDGRDGIHLSLPQPAYIDVEAAEAALRRARSSPGAEERLAGAQEAATIVAAGLLPGLEAPWLEHERAGLARLRTEALELGAEAAMSIEPPDRGDTCGHGHGSSRDVWELVMARSLRDAPCRSVDRRLPQACRGFAGLVWRKRRAVSHLDEKIPDVDLAPRVTPRL